jgi:plasmid stability protein
VSVTGIDEMSYMSYIDDMNATIRNVDERLYRALKARAASEHRTIGDVLNDAIRSYLGARPRGRASLFDLRPLDFGPGSERTSETIDESIHGARR